VQYMLLIYGDERHWDQRSEAERRETLDKYMCFTQELREDGAFLSADRLQPTANATTIRIRDGETLVTDGPFAETKEQLGGYYVVEAESLDEAIAWAAKIPAAQHGSVEVRPLMQVPAEARQG
jgi:hypothetical protein